MSDYQKQVNRSNPGLVIFCLDDSGSTTYNLAGTNDPRFMWVALYLGIILKLLLSRSTEMRGDAATVKPRYYVHTIIYGSQPQLWGTEEMDIQTAVELYTQNSNSVGLGGKLKGTDSDAALHMVYDYARQAVASERFRDSFPPMVFHLTDGESQTDASAIAEQIKQLQTSDGNVLMVNAYIGTQTSLGYAGPEDFPGYVDVNEAGPSDDNIRMFNMSSEMPDSIRSYLVESGIFPQIRKGSRLFFDVRTKDMLQHVIQIVSSVGSRADK